MELTEAFNKLEMGILNIVYRLRADGKFTISLQHMSSEAKRFYTNFWDVPEIDSQARKWRLQRKLFDVLNKAFFQRPCFGLKQDIETELGRLEKKFFESKDCKRS